MLLAERELGFFYNFFPPLVVSRPKCYYGRRRSPTSPNLRYGAGVKGRRKTAVTHTARDEKQKKKKRKKKEKRKKEKKRKEREKQSH
jgi:hypothetical protein